MREHEHTDATPHLKTMALLAFLHVSLNFIFILDSVLVICAFLDFGKCYVSYLVGWPSVISNAFFS